MPEIKEVKDSLDTLVKGVTALQEKQTEFEKNSGTATATTTKEIEALKKTVVDTVETMQKEKQEAAALAQKQKEDFELMQKEIIAKSGDSDEGLKKKFAEYDNHLAKYLKKRIPIPESIVQEICKDIAQKSLYGVEDSDVAYQAKDLVAGSNADGGFFLTTDRSSSMSTRIFETSAIRQLASLQTTTSDMWEIVLDDDEPDSGWVGEVTERGDTDTAQVGLVKIPIHEVFAQPKATQKMIDDAGFDIVAWHQAKVTSKFSRDENTAFVAGDGAAKPKGFLDYSAWDTAGTYQRNAIEQIVTSTATTILADDLIQTQGSLFEGYQAMAEWAMARQTFFNNILTLKDENNNYLINPRLVAEGGQMVLLGKPVNLFADMPIVANNSLSVTYADWREFYTIVDRMGVRVLRDPYTTKGYIKFYTTKRVGGAVTNYEAGKILKTLSS